ncbi:hypothetical protein V491_08717, partial [Pseudogymnoascus sp. VKM F-3775]
NSPSISQALWENFQPDQLFPEGSGVVGMQNSPPQGNAQWGSPPGMGGMGRGQRMGSMGSQGGQGDVGMSGLYPPGNGTAPGAWGAMGQPGFDGAQGAQGQSPSESWSSATAVPATLNVEDWFQFFGINGDLSGMNAADLLTAAAASV